MKKLLMMLLVLAGTVTFSNVQAQEQGGMQRRSPEEAAKMQVERLTKALSLTEEQQTKVSAICLTQAKSRDSIFTAMGQGGDREVMRAKAAELSTASQEKILAVLNEEQQKIYNQHLKDLGARRSGGGQRPPKSN